MPNPNPFGFVDPRLVQFPTNKKLQCVDEPSATTRPDADTTTDATSGSQTYFNGPLQLPSVAASPTWAYDNYFGAQHRPFDVRSRRGDRVNIEVRMLAIHEQEAAKLVPCTTQAWYGHRAPRFEQRLVEHGVGRAYEMEAMLRPNGWPVAKRGTTAGRSEADVNRTLVQIIKPTVL